MLTDILVWKNRHDLEPSLKAELNAMNDGQLQEVFTHNIAFGTGGMRGLMGVGTDRINIYTIRKATMGLAQYFLKIDTQAKNKGVVIAFDTRLNSTLFAQEAARVLLSYGIRVYLFDEFRSTPQLSFAVRHYHAVGGIMLTASHNPPQYNGYKIYNEQGCQFVPYEADQVIDLINSTTDYFDISLPKLNQHPQLISIKPSFDDIYLKAIAPVSVQKVDAKSLRIVFTPLHGVASVYGPSMLKKLGYDVHVVPEQMVNDPYFKAVKSPNPEEKGAFEKAIEIGKGIGAQLLLATDPDADRVGVAVWHQGNYRLLNGNETGALIINYLSQFRKSSKAGVVFSTIVSSDLALAIAAKHGFETYRTLTGFKFIGEQIEITNKLGKQFVFGFEESYGYLLSDVVRDKDAFQALIIIAEIAAYYLSIGKTLIDVLADIHTEYGYYQESLINIHLLGLDGMSRMARIMETAHHQIPLQIAGLSLSGYADYLLQKEKLNGKETTLTLPVSDVVKYYFSQGGWVVFRPSGTEPKLKIYISLRGDSSDAVKSQLEILEKALKEWVNAIN